MFKRITCSVKQVKGVEYYLNIYKKSVKCTFNLEADVNSNQIELQKYKTRELEYQLEEL